MYKSKTLIVERPSFNAEFSTSKKWFYCWKHYNPTGDENLNEISIKRAMLIIRGFFFFFFLDLIFIKNNFMARNKTCCSGISPTRQPQLLFQSITRFGRIRTVRRSMILNEKFKPTLFPETRLIDFREKDEILGLKTNLDFSNFLEGQGSSRFRDPRVP